MKRASNFSNDKQTSLAYIEDWRAFFESALQNDSPAANSVAHLLFALKETIESGPDGVRQAASTLLDGISLAYLYTNEHQLALKLYLLYLTGQLTPQNEPNTLLSAAIDRGTAEVERARKAKR